MRSIIPDLLFIGNARDARDVRAVLSFGVQAVVDLAANEPAIQYPRDIAYCRFPLTDGTGNDPAILRLAVSTTAEFIQAKIPVLVACQRWHEPIRGSRGGRLIHRSPPGGR